MRTIRMFGHEFPVETIRQHYKANANGLRKMVERSLKTGKYNGYTTAQLIEKADMYERIATEL